MQIIRETEEKGKVASITANTGGCGCGCGCECGCNCVCGCSTPTS